MKPLGILSLTLCAAACGKQRADDTRPGPSLATPRQLVSRSLFGELPLDNRFLDPRFGNVDGFTWLAYNMTGSSWPNAVRTHRLGTPLGAPALLLDKDIGSSAVVVTGAARAVNGPWELGAWIGRPVEVAETADVPALSFVGYDAASGDTGFDLELDPDTAAYEAEGIRWERWRAGSQTGLLGWATLVLEESSNDDLLLGAPVLRALPVPTAFHPGAGRGGRPLRAVEADAVARLRRALGERLRLPPRAARAQLP